MKLTINKDTTTKEIKDQFANEFEGLKIEFVKNDHESGEGSSPDQIISENMNVGELSTSAVSASLEITSRLTVAEVEQIFSDQLGLNIQIFRKSGRVWIETVNTDSWTLESQMESSHN